MIANILIDAVEGSLKSETSMQVRQNFASQSNLPPRMFLEQIMDKPTKAYCWLWDLRDERNRLEMSWQALSAHYNKNTFRTALRKLCNQGLISWEESIDGFTIEMVGWDELVNGD
jgi:hypothetical protein